MENANENNFKNFGIKILFYVHTSNNPHKTAINTP